ncbi:MAG TPA: hypothetical protein VFA39_11900 [Steroidobacteraceae bacterium]|nr:hypothetical protein [Steroidobacteraceae bacterium]
MLKSTWSWRLAAPLATCVALAALLAAPTRVTAREKPPLARTAPLFEFHSNFWVNLHQVLFHEAWLRAGKPVRGLQSAAPLSAAGMSSQDEADWRAAVSFYAAHFANRQQHGDDQLIQINDDLAGQPDNGARLSPPDLPPELIAVLHRAAGVYRRYWWPAHDESNEHWIASQAQRLQHLGPGLAAAMTKDLHQQWPAAPIRVDVCHYVVALGYALTTLPPHITFSSSDPFNPGLDRFELLFHEASHTFADTTMNALETEGRAQHKDVGDLWHSLLFYTSGVELRRLLPASEQATFTPYGYRNRVYGGGHWPAYRRVLEADWQPYLDGKIDFTDAIHSMVADLP